MKTRTSPIWISGLALLLAWSPGGLAQNEIDHPPAFGRDAAPVLWPVPPGPALTSSTNVLPKLRLSPWTREIVKLAQVGIDESVMVSFIDNSGMFNLGADQIIYLSDLGVPDEIINEMLRHDSEVIAGVRKLTISSEPPRDPSLQITFTTDSSASNKTEVQPATTSAPPASANTPSAGVPIQQPLPEAMPDGNNSFKSVWETAMADEGSPYTAETPSQQRQSSADKGSYPVREPYPVPLTAPIIFVQAAGPPPDTYVIEWFPQTDR